MSQFFSETVKDRITKFGVCLQGINPLMEFENEKHTIIFSGVIALVTFFARRGMLMTMSACLRNEDNFLFFMEV